MPSIATVALVIVVSEWNDYIWPLIITDRPETMTLPVGLTLLQNSEGNGSGWGILMAGAVLVIVPILLVFAAPAALHRGRPYPGQRHRLTARPTVLAPQSSHPTSQHHREDPPWH